MDTKTNLYHTYNISQNHNLLLAQRHTCTQSTSVTNNQIIHSPNHKRQIADTCDIPLISLTLHSTFKNADPTKIF